METIKKQKYESDRSFCIRIIDILKSHNEVKIERCELEKLLSYLEVYKVGKVEFHIMYSNTNDFLTLYLGLVTGLVKKTESIQKEIDFTGLICYNKQCNMHTKNNLCMSQGRCKICSNKIVNPIINESDFSL
jgi:hypothetical protein